MANNDEIDELRDLLDNLRIQQAQTTEAIDRIERLLHEDGGNARRTVTTRRRTIVRPRNEPVLRNLQLRDFERGQQVRILNPSRGEVDVGTVLSVGTRFVSIRREGASDTRRIPRNLEIIQDV